MNPTNHTPPLAPTPAPLDLTGRLTLRQDEVARALGISSRTMHRERNAGHFPRPDLFLGRMPLWRLETLQAWLARKGKP